MAKLPNGMLGGMSGKLGNLITVTRNGVTYVRTKPASVKDPKSPAQLRQRERFALVMDVVKRIKPFLRAGYAGSRQMGNGNTVNRAIAFNIRNAVKGEWPGQLIDYTQLLVAEGDLPGCPDAQASLEESRYLTLGWSDNSGRGGARVTDQLMVLVWCPEINESVDVLSGPARPVGNYRLELPSSFVGRGLHVYAAFRSADGSETSDSNWAGSF